MDEGRWEEVGDPVCWVNRVCPECGRFRVNPDFGTCENCGAPFADDGDPPTRASGATAEHDRGL
jgi:uncharacterized protein